MDRTHVDWNDVEAAAEQAANNHADFESFGWHDRPDDAHEWAIVYTHNRDSDLLTLSNADAIAKALEPFEEDAIAERHSHWACGWVDGYALRVYRNGQITAAFRHYCELRARLEDYPCLDEEDYSRREHEACLDAIAQEGRRHAVSKGVDWVAMVHEWLSDNEPGELENRDGNGAYPSEAAVRAALFDLDLLDATYSVRVGDHVVFESASNRRAFREARTLLYHQSMDLGIAAGETLTVERDGETIDPDVWQ